MQPLERQPVVGCNQGTHLTPESRAPDKAWTPQEQAEPRCDQGGKTKQLVSPTPQATDMDLQAPCQADSSQFLLERAAELWFSWRLCRCHIPVPAAQQESGKALGFFFS